MTLYRQLLIFTAILFILLFSGTWVSEFKNTQTFLNNQLISHAQDTATSLGLAIQPYLNDADLVMVETMVNSIVDSGYYRRISVHDNDGKVIYEQKLELKIEAVPQWFVDFIPMETPSASTLLSSGWNQAGNLTVESHPGYAYKTLWDDTVYMATLFLVTFFLVLGLGGLGLRFLLRPLARVEEQANGLCNKQFEVQTSIPRTRELKRVVETMNRMTLRVKAIFAEQVALAERFREQAFRDQLTGFGNRRYFDYQVKARMDRGGERVRGGLFIIQINNLRQLNQKRGFVVGDKFIVAVSQEIKKATTGIANCALNRISGGDFAVFLPDVGREELEQIASSLAQHLSGLANYDITLDDNICHIGIAVYQETVPVSEMLATADQALRSAQQQGPNAWIIRTTGTGTSDSMGLQQWTVKLAKVIDQESLILFGQPAVSCSDHATLRHVEIFSRLLLDGDIVNAGMFMPLADRLGVVGDLDKIVLKKTLALDKSVTPLLAINMAASSLRDKEFCEWVLRTLEHCSSNAPRLILEFAEFGAVQQLDMLKDFSEHVRRTGNNVALDHFGQSFSNFGYLNSLKPEYVKIDRAYTSELIDTESDASFFVSSLCSVAHSLDIDVIAEGVETEEQAALLQELHLDAVQGYLVDHPKAIEECGSKN